MYPIIYRFMLITYRGRDKISKDTSDFQNQQFIPNSDISNLETFDSFLLKAATPQVSISPTMSTLTGYSRIPNGYDSFTSIPNGKDRTSEFVNALKSMQMQAQQRAVSFLLLYVVCFID